MIGLVGQNSHQPDNIRPNDIRVMIVDDALVIRGMLTKILDQHAGVRVVAAVSDGLSALKKLTTHTIDVVILDIEMPKMDGLTALPKIIEKSPGIQVLMSSTHTLRSAEVTLNALNLGAADYVTKPTTKDQNNSLEIFKREIVSRVKVLGPIAQTNRRNMAESHKKNLGTSTSPPIPKSATLGNLKQVNKVQAGEFATTDKGQTVAISLRKGIPYVPDFIAIGSSTGGPQALFNLIRDIDPRVTQPILIVQHMPPAFTTILAKHMEKSSGRRTEEGQEGAQIQSGHIYIAPGNYHMQVTTQNGVNRIQLNQQPPENFCRPSVDPLFRSLAALNRHKILGIILTGMGSDGCKGSEVLVQTGAQIFAQDEATSVVWGMPGAVARAGLCTHILPLDKMSQMINTYALGGNA